VNRAGIYDGNLGYIKCDSVFNTGYFKAVTGGRKVNGKEEVRFKRKAGVLLLKHKNVIIEDDYMSELVQEREKTMRNVKLINRLKELYRGGTVPFDYELAPTSFPPMTHQRVMFNIVAHCNFGALLADPGTGKTASYLWGIDSRRKRGWTGKVLIITLKGLCKNVVKEMRQVTPDLKGVVLNGTDHADKVINKKFVRGAKNVDYDVYLTSYESVRHLIKVIPDGYFDMIILDEAHRIAAPDSKQTEAIVGLKASYKYIATGTMHGNNEMSFYMPYYFLAPYLTGFGSYKSFRETIMIPIDDEKRIWVPTGKARKTVSDVTTPHTVHFNKYDCVDDLPDLVEMDYEFELSPTQQRVCEEIKAEGVSMIEEMCSKCDRQVGCPGLCVDDTVMVNHILTMNKKLQQVANGYFVKTMSEIDDDCKEIDTSATIVFDENPRLDVLCDIIDQIPDDEKIIVWSIETRATKMIIEYLQKKGYKVAWCYGNDDAFEKEDAFRKDGHIMVANPTKMGTGLNMQYTSYQVGYFIDHSFVKYDQMVGRSHRKGAKNTVFMYRMIANNAGADQRVVGCVTKKHTMSKELQEGARLVIDKQKK